MLFAFRLAAHLGIVDPIRGVLGKLNSDLLALWAAYLEREPFPADRADVREAYHTATICNQWLPEDAEPIDVESLVIPWADAVADESGTDAESREAEAMREITAILTHFG